MQYKKSLECLLTSGALLLASNTAFAQVAPQPEQPAAPAPAAAVKGEENVVVVTANRVRSNAQTTPVALSVYSGTALADAGVSSVNALQTIDPSVGVTASTGNAYVAIRGIASTDTTEIGDPSVPIARDGFFTNRSFSIATSMYDMERVEVLKGPQGTLFGRNSTGGLINIITAKPKESFGGYVSAELGNYSAVNLEGAVNVPLSDKVQLRVSAIKRKHDGYRTVTGINLEGDDENNRSGRVQLAFQPFDGFDGLVSYQKDKADFVGDVTKVLPVGVNTDIGDSQTFPGFAPVSTRIEGERARWEFSYNRLPLGLTLTYAGGYDTQKFRRLTDATGPAYPAVRQFRQNESPDTRNHEVRLATPINQPITAQLGYFYFEEKNLIDSGVYVLSMNPGVTPNYAGKYGIKFDYNVNTKADGVFSQVGWKLTEDLKLTVGARYSRDEKERIGQAVLTLGALANPAIGAPPITNPGSGNTKSSKPTYQVGLDWMLTPQNFLYAKIATGYKSGGFNSNGSAASVPYDEENVRSLELGTKNRFMNRKVQFNAALFHQKYEGYQGSQSSDALVSGGIFNVGNATIKGLETELIANVPDVARFDFNATFLDAKFGQGISIREGSNPPVLRAIGGNRLPNSPKVVFTAGVQRTFEIGESNLMARLSAKHSEDFYYSVFNDADSSSPAYTTYNALATFKRNGSDWEVQAYVNNLTDETVLANRNRNWVARVNAVQFQPPRTYGMRVRYTF